MAIQYHLKKNNMEEEILIAEELADQIMRWDWRDSFREENKKSIEEMFIAYAEQERKKNNSVYAVFDSGGQGMKDMGLMGVYNDQEKAKEDIGVTNC